MAKLEILEFPDPRLRTVAKPVENFDAALRELVADMADAMHRQDGVGLAATQVNVHRRLLVLDVSPERNQLCVYVNPEILHAEGTRVTEEGCLSVPGVFAEVSRAETIRVRASDVEGKPFEQTLSGIHAICLQHEMDHLQGKLFVDYLSPLKRLMVQKKLDKQRRQGQKSTVAAL